MTVKIKTQDVWTVINALRAAAEVYTKDGAKCAACGDHRTAMQFHAQSANVLQLANELEAA